MFIPPSAGVKYNLIKKEKGELLLLGTHNHLSIEQVPSHRSGWLLLWCARYCSFKADLSLTVVKLTFKGQQRINVTFRLTQFQEVRVCLRRAIDIYGNGHETGSPAVVFTLS